MLKILIGTDWIANRDKILACLASDVKQQKPGRILMVPELISHDTERRLADVAGDTCSRFAEVLSFTRLARRVSDAVGCAVMPCLDNGGRVVAMAAAVRRIHSQLKAYAAVESKPEFLTELVDAVDEFKRCCINSDTLRSAARRSEGAFAQKLEELALILDSYNSVTSRSKRDPRDQMNWLLEVLKDSDFASDHVFYIDGFPDFTRQHWAVLEHLVTNSPQVTVSLTCDRIGSTAMAYEKAGKTALELSEFAQKQGVPCQVCVVPTPESPLHSIRDALFQGVVRFEPELNGKLLLRRGDSIYDECSGAAARVLELARQGCRYRDIGIVCADMGAYENLLRLAFSRGGIPVYRSGTDDVLKKTVIRSLLSALEAALGGFERADVLRYMKSVLSPLEQGACDCVENYVILWGISASRWTTHWENHPVGLGEEWNDSFKALLADLNAARAALIDPLVRLRNGFRDAVNLADQIDALCNFFEDISLADRLSQLADHMDGLGDNRSAQILNQLWEILLTALEQLHDVLGETVWDSDSFVRLFTLLLSQYDVGTIPSVLDSVTVGPISAMRCHQVRHLMVLGAHEGALPGYAGTAGILTDKEREKLRLLDVPLTGGGMEGLQSEFGDICGVFSSASDSVLVSCGPDQPSYLYNRLLTMAGGDKKYEDISVQIMTDPRDAAAILAAYEDRNAAVELGIEQEYDAFASKADYRVGALSKSNIQSLYGSHLKLSASQIEKHADCRFAYFLHYGLYAKELREASVDPAEFGTYFHAVLENTCIQVMELGGFHEVTLEKTMELAMAHSDAYIAERFSALESERLSYLIKRNVQELECLVRELWEELSVSLFEPVAFELEFGYGTDMPAVDIPGAQIPAKIKGKVDRVDKWNDGHNDYFRVVDYKSGIKSFDYCDVFNGIGLQMLLYLFALRQNGNKVLGSNPIPAGVQYFSARYLHLLTDHLLDDLEAAELRGSSLIRKGLVLADEAVIRAMEPEGAPHRVSAEWNKKGQIKGDLADRDQLKQLEEYVFMVLKDQVDDIASGNVEPNPYTRGSYHNACRYCPFGSVCHRNTVIGRRNYQKMSRNRFWEDVEKEVGDNG